MENIVLTIHLILALCLIGVVLLQRSEGGGLGMGGGGGAVSGRAAATALSKMTWIFAIGFLTTSITLTIIAASNAGQSSVLDQPGIEIEASEDGAALPGLIGLEGTIVPPAADDAPLAPPPSE